VGAARDLLAAQMNATDANKLIDDSIATVEARLH
jgi:F-type H+-transporting ATPase subunit b